MSKVKVLADPGSGRNPLPGLQMAVFFCAFLRQRGRECGRVRKICPLPLFLRTLIPSWVALLS